MTSTTETNGTSAATASETSIVPNWVTEELFENVVRESIGDYKKINSFKAYPALTAGENYATIMLRVDIEVQLNDDKQKKISYMLKIAHDLEMFKQMMKQHNIFDVETMMYRGIVPDFEQIYRDAGLDVKLGAHCYTINAPKDVDYVLLEDLRTYGFKNANRLEGLDLDHIKCVLKKLAQWHAASAVRVETKGKYPEILVTGFFKPESLPMMKQINESLLKPFWESLELYEGHEIYVDSLRKLKENYTEEVYRLFKADPNEFQVLNHGDCWSNNVMFQYDAFGKIKETYFVDYQIPKYGTPAQDLFYFLMSSAKLELKFKQFDYFIKFYHDNLVEHLSLLKYKKKLPTLKELHIMLYKYGLWGFSTASSVMAAVLLDPMENANLENFMGNTEEGQDMKRIMFTNARYRKHIEAVLPWLYNRGAFEC